MGAIKKVVKADVALHALKAVATGLGLYAAIKGLRAALGATNRGK